MITSAIEEVGIPVVQITTVVDVPKTVGVSRILRGNTISSPLGDTSLDAADEESARKRLVEKAMEMLVSPGEKGVVVVP